MTLLAKTYAENRCFNVTVTIADGETVSEAVDLYGTALCGIIVPANLEGTSLGLQGANSFAGTYLTVYDSAGTAISITTVAGAGSARYIALDHNEFTSLQFIKLTGSSQTGDAVFTLVTKPVN